MKKVFSMFLGLCLFSMNMYGDVSDCLAPHPVIFSHGDNSQVIVETKEGKLMVVFKDNKLSLEKVTQESGFSNGPLLFVAIIFLSILAWGIIFSLIFNNANILIWFIYGIVVLFVVGDMLDRFWK